MEFRNRLCFTVSSCLYLFGRMDLLECAFGKLEFGGKTMWQVLIRVSFWNEVVKMFSADIKFLFA